MAWRQLTLVSGVALYHFCGHSQFKYMGVGTAFWDGGWQMVVSPSAAERAVEIAKGVFCA